jgi:ABC-type Fe3+-hydroxamate transport system substrate-binding protein
MPAQRVVSLVPSSTETLLALGVQVIACTRFCEQPNIAHVGGTKNPDIDAIVQLRPDLVVMDREENRREDAEALERRGMTLCISDVRTVRDAIDIVDRLAGLGGVAAPGAALPTAAVTTAITAFVPIWRRPWMTINASTYGASILEHIGVRTVTADYPSTYPQVALDEIASLRPTMVLVPSEPYDFHDAHMRELAEAFGADVPIRRIDGQDLFWWGSRTPGAIARLADAVADVAGSSGT